MYNTRITVETTFINRPTSVKQFGAHVIGICSTNHFQYTCMRGSVKDCPCALYLCSFSAFICLDVSSSGDILMPKIIYNKTSWKVQISLSKHCFRNYNKNRPILYYDLYTRKFYDVPLRMSNVLLSVSIRITVQNGWCKTKILSGIQQIFFVTNMFLSTKLCCIFLHMYIFV